MKSKHIKTLVNKKYEQIANQSKQQNENSCCGVGGCCSGMDYTIFSENYSSINGYESDADLGLGCGIPTQFADIKKGDHVLDLGSGAGNDCFVASAIVGETGKVVGLDFTDAMILKANENAKKLGVKNIEFIKGDIEEMPFTGDCFDMVISNCVLNLVPDKNKAFTEIFRVLKPNGRFCISDVVLEGCLPDKLQRSIEMYAGCVAGAINLNDYMRIIEEAGFKNITLHKQKDVEIPESILSRYLSKIEMENFKINHNKIMSVTISANK